MRQPIFTLAITLLASGCMPTVRETLAVSCTQYIGRPISERIAAYGPPKATYRISATQIGYIFESRDTQFFGNEPYYEVNYLTGVDKRRTPIRPATTVCRGNFVVFDDGTPGSQRLIIDVVPGY